MIPIYHAERRHHFAAAGRVVCAFAAAVCVVALVFYGLAHVKADIDDEALPGAFAAQTERARVVADLRRHVTPCRPPRLAERLVVSVDRDGRVECSYLAESVHHEAPTL